jgi:hypothetical protein
MTLGEKLEQALTHRPNSVVPAHTLERLLGLPTKPDGQRPGCNLVMHEPLSCPGEQVSWGQLLGHEAGAAQPGSVLGSAR